MNESFFIILTIFLFGAIISELLSLIFYKRIVSFYNKEPEEILGDNILKYLSFFSISYLIAVLMLLFCGVGRFELYGIIISLLSLGELLFRKVEKGRHYRVVIGSVLTLTLLLDTVRQLTNSFL